MTLFRLFLSCVCIHVTTATEYCGVLPDAAGHVEISGTWGEIAVDIIHVGVYGTTWNYDHSFYSCASLKTATIGHGIYTIGIYGFAYSALKNITIPNSVVQIAKYAFLSCTDLTHIIIKHDTIQIATEAFLETYILKSFILPLHAQIEQNAFMEVPCPASKYTAGANVCNCEDCGCPIQPDAKGIVVIPSDWTYLGIDSAHSFIHCSFLVGIQLTDNITRIGENSFDGCTSFKHIVFPPNVTSIGAYAFRNCIALDNLIIPSTIITINTSAFHGSTNLNTIQFPDNITIAETAFLNTGCGVTLYTGGAQLCNCLCNYNPLFFSVVDFNVSCASYCAHTLNCQGFIETLPGVIPHICQIATTQDNINISTHLNAELASYTAFQPRDCNALDTDIVCYARTQTCLICPRHLKTWESQVQSGYTIFFTSDCCSSSISTEWLSDKQTNITIDFTYTVFIDDLTFTTTPGVTIYARQCPLFTTTSHVQRISFLDLKIVCLNASNSTAGIIIKQVPFLSIRMTNVSIEEADAGLVLLGGSRGNDSITPAFTNTDISNSYFSNVYVQSTYVAITPAIALASYTGRDIHLGVFDALTLITIQPTENDDNRVPMFTPETRQNVYIFNITTFTQIFGDNYEINFQHTNAFEINAETASMSTLLKYDIAFFIFLFILVFVLNQDLFYYRSKLKKM